MTRPQVGDFQVAIREVSLRQSYRAGEKLFVDYAGQTMELIAPTTGDTREAYLFVATLGASNYTYAEVTLARDLPSWISSHVRALEFFGGVPEIVVPDNPKTGVTSPCRYEPDINPTYHDMASHYGTVVIPARVARPKDKAKVESAVLVARALDTPVETGCAVQNPIDDLFAC